MVDPLLTTSILSEIPEEWKERFIIKRIDEEDITITIEERNNILESLNKGTRFVQIGKYTLMLNAIKSIDPLFEPDNIPPRPKEQIETKFGDDGIETKLLNQDKINLWDKLYLPKVNARLELPKEE